MYRQNKKNSVLLEGMGEGTDKQEEKELAVSLAKKELPALEGMVNGKKVRGRRRYQVIETL